MNLHNVRMNVIQTAAAGVVNEATVFVFSQEGHFVSADYAGGPIVKGYLVGFLEDDVLRFSYCQLQTDGKIDHGDSRCTVYVSNGKLMLEEIFVWGSRGGESGKNVFRQL